MSDYTPDTERVRYAYAHSVMVSGPEMRNELAAEFDRWLEAHDREVQAIAWDDGYAAGATDDQFPSNPYRTEECEDVA